MIQGISRENGLNKKNTSVKKNEVHAGMMRACSSYPFRLHESPAEPRDYKCIDEIDYERAHNGNHKKGSRSLTVKPGKRGHVRQSVRSGPHAESALSAAENG